MDDNSETHMLIHEYLQFNPGTTIYSTNRIDFPISQTQAILNLHIERTTRYLASDPLDEAFRVLQHISVTPTMDACSMCFANLTTVDGCKTEVSKLHTFVTSQLECKEEHWAYFVEKASDIVHQAARKALVDKPAKLVIVMDVEVQQNVLVACDDDDQVELLVVHESMQDDEDDDDTDSDDDDDYDDVMQESIDNNDGFHDVPAADSAVAALETKKFDQEGMQKICTICLDEFLMGVNVTRMPCSHVFHQDCIVNWLQKKNTCPLCRFQMPT